MSKGFSKELVRWGPDAPRRKVSLAEARAYCRRFARGEYENFSVVTAWLPRPMRPHFYAIYAYCRWADNLGDETGGGAKALSLLRWWREELMSCYQGRASHPVMVALADTILTYEIPHQPFVDLLYAFEQDQLVKRYESYDQLLDYCRYSANPVGRLLLYVFRSHDEVRGELSDHVCTALQLTNFWQDVARDYMIGRVYLPEEDCRRFHYSHADLTARRYTPEFAGLMRFEVERTRDLFYRGMPLVELVSHEVRIDVELFIQGGLAILRKIEQIDYDVWKQRPRLAKWEKVMLVSRVVAGRGKARLSQFARQMAGRS